MSSTSVLERVAGRIEEETDELARLVSLEQGRPLSLVRIEVDAAFAWTRASVLWTCRSRISRTPSTSVSSCTSSLCVAKWKRREFLYFVIF